MLRSLPRLKSLLRCLSSAYSIGQEFGGFLLEETTTIAELDLEMLQFKHARLGTKYVHVKANDRKNTFGVAFKTPGNDNGLTHVLEHCVLCGSERFPVRDPFFLMLPRTVASFMNAMTAVDHTMYPFSTDNARDFYNLLGVYLDTTFFPLLREVDFHQEAHRLEVGKDGLERTGVVLNEMKGALSDPRRLFGAKLDSLFHGDSIYGQCSGGRPEIIPSLTHADLTAYHAKAYHPSNCLLFTYGDLEFERHIEEFNSRVLHRFEAPPADLEEFDGLMRGRSPLGTGSHEMEGPCLDHLPLEEQHVFERRYALPSSLSSPREVMVLSILESLLFGGVSSPFYKRVMATGLVKSLSGSGLGVEAPAPSFAFHFGAVRGDAVASLPGIIDETLAKVLEEGFDQRRVEGILHSTEMAIKLKEAELGVKCMQFVALEWAHGKNAAAGLQVNALLEWVRGEMARDPRFLEARLEKALRGREFVELAMRPSAAFSEELRVAEAAELERVDAALTAEERERIAAETVELREWQSAFSSASCLPTLTLEDVAKSPREERVQLVPVGLGAPVQVNEAPSIAKGVVVVRMRFTANEVPAELLPLVGYLPSVLPHLGGGALDSGEMEVAMASKLNSFRVFPTVVAGPRLGLGVEFICFDRNLDDAIALVTDVLFQPDLADLTTIRAIASGVTASLAQSRWIAAHIAACKVNPAGRLQSLLSGPHCMSVGAALQQREDGAEVMSRAFQEILGLFRDGAVGIVAHPDGVRRALSAVESSLLPRLPGAVTLPGKAAMVLPSSLPIPNGAEGSQLVRSLFHLPEGANARRLLFPFPSQGCQTCAAWGAPGWDESGKSASLAVLSRHMSWKVLHSYIREEGGAYGSSASSLSALERFQMSSMCDPAPLRSLEFMQRVCGEIDLLGVSEEALMEGKLDELKRTTAVLSPHSEGIGSFFYGRTAEQLQEHHSRVREVTQADLQRVCDEFLSEPQPVLVSVGNDGREELLASGFIDISSLQ